jgi:sugar transferase (PEP-CTERM/EpsH1 system associated)
MSARMRPLSPPDRPWGAAAYGTEGAPQPGGPGPRLIQVIPSLQVGGLEKGVVRIAHHLNARVDQVIVTLSTSGPLATGFPSRTRVIAVGDRHPPDRWNALRLTRLFRSLRPDIVHTRNWTCIDAIVAARLARVPVVIQGEHGRDATDPTGRNWRRQRVRRMLAPLVTQFVTVSRDLARWLIEDVRVPARKVRTIYNGVDTCSFSPGDREAARRGLGVPDGWKVVGTVGRLDPVKDHEGLIQAFARVPQDGPVLLVLVGDGPLRARLATAVARLDLQDRIRILGDRDDIPLLLRSFDVFVLPSVGEGVSNALLEAMATGLPVVATQVGGNQELVQEGVTGRLVEARCPEALADVITAYVKNTELARRHGAAGRVRVEREFSLTRMLAAYEELYREHLSLEAHP